MILRNEKKLDQLQNSTDLYCIYLFIAMNIRKVSPSRLYRGCVCFTLQQVVQRVVKCIRTLKIKVK